MGIIVRNLSCNAFSNIRMGNTERIFPFNVYEYPFDDDYVIITPEPISSDVVTLSQDGFTFSSSCIHRASLSTRRAFIHDGSLTWLSCSGAVGSTRNISAELPTPFKIDAIRLRGLDSNNTNWSFNNGIVQGRHNGIWETIYSIGRFPTYIWTDIIPLKLTKEYDAYRVVGTVELHISNRYVGLGAFHLLSKK